MPRVRGICACYAVFRLASSGNPRRGLRAETLRRAERRAGGNARDMGSTRAAGEPIDVNGKRLSATRHEGVCVGRECVGANALGRMRWGECVGANALGRLRWGVCVDANAVGACAGAAHIADLAQQEWLTARRRAAQANGQGPTASSQQPTANSQQPRSRFQVDSAWPQRAGWWHEFGRMFCLPGGVDAPHQANEAVFSCSLQNSGGNHPILPIASNQNRCLQLSLRAPRPRSR